MENESDQDRADEADQDHHQMIVEYVGSDPTDSGGCLGLIVVVATVFAVAFRQLLF